MMAEDIMGISYSSLTFMGVQLGNCRTTHYKELGVMAGDVDTSLLSPLESREVDRMRNWLDSELNMHFMPDGVLNKDF